MAGSWTVTHSVVLDSMKLPLMRRGTVGRVEEAKGRRVVLMLAAPLALDERAADAESSARAAAEADARMVVGGGGLGMGSVG